jgi:Spy/CpxP family protein refolding chaperone
MTRLLSALVALALLTALPVAATAQAPQTNAPPGNSAIDEYLETVPSATGNQRPRQPGTGGGASVLTPAQRAKLERLGPDGKALADAVDATAPPAAKPGETIDSGSDKGRSPISAVFDAVTGSDGGGMGFMLPVILLASLLGVIALVVMRRRSVS